jgi:hypothetical protein
MNPACEQPADDATPKAGRFAGWVLPPYTRRVRMTPRPPLLRVDPAETIYREQVRRDVEAAHKWLAQQVKP